MKKLLFICLMGSLCGCIAGWNMTRMTGNVNGNDLNTPAGKANGNVTVNSITCWQWMGGKCPEYPLPTMGNLVENTNSDNGSSLNTTK